MPDFAREFTELCSRIAEAERRVEAQRATIARSPGGGDEVVYAGVLAGVLERSLAVMYRRRDRIERELCAFRRAERTRRAATPAPSRPARRPVGLPRHTQWLDRASRTPAAARPAVLAR